MTPVKFALALTSVLIVLAGCDGADTGNPLKKVNGSVHVAAGAAPQAAETVNGDIHIDDSAAVTEVNTVNGGIQLGNNVAAGTLTTVNGGITVGSNSHVAKDATSVNGNVTLRDGADVLGAVSNVNGKIELTAAHVAKGIKTVAGDIVIRGPSRVEGGILVEKTSQLIQFGSSVPRIEIGPGATVQGELRFQREVKLFVSDRATIGPVTGATPVPFAGDTAPAG
jgi:acetyltransferase-like isoleucine patch superfamily enzyme